jgi:hypothetical protein
MKRYSEDAWERAMKVQDVILRAMAKRSIRLGRPPRSSGPSATISVPLHQLPDPACAPTGVSYKPSASLKAEHNLPYGDCFAAALAQAREASLVTSDKGVGRAGSLVRGKMSAGPYLSVDVLSSPPKVIDFGS